MNKIFFAVVIVLVSFFSIFAEIKFQTPVKAISIGFPPSFDYLAQSPGSDTVYSRDGVFNVKTGVSYNIPGVAAIDWDGLHNIWYCLVNSNLLTVKNTAGQQTSYSLADGKGFGIIHAIKFSEGTIVVGCDSGLSITTPVNGVPGAWTNLSTKPIKEVVAKHGQIWALSYSNDNILYRDSSGTLLSYSYANILIPEHCDIDTAGNFWLSYHRNIGTNTEEAGLMKFDGKNWTKVLVTEFNFINALIDTIAFGIIRVDKYNQLWFVNDVLTDGYTFSLGKIDLTRMSIEKINYVGVMNPSTGANYPAPLSWTPLTVTITPSGEALIGGIGCFVRVDYGSSVIWHPVVAKVPSVYQKNLSGYIFDPLGRRIASANSFSINLSAGNYYSWPVNSRKAGNISVLK